MSPRAIVEKGLEKGLDMIALCDHNTAENVGAALRAGAKKGITVIPGMEINTREEVHILGLFQDEARALDMQRIVYSHLKGTNRPELFGDQVVANERDEVEGFNDRLLIGATGLTLQEVIREIRRLGGLSIASHIDRPSYSLLSQLGFVPPDAALDGVEISRPVPREEMDSQVPGIGQLPMIRSSDAHFLKDIGKACTSFFMEAPNIVELGLALAGKDGRRIVA
jgi:predicted metal-dependent phosphoesterase TrpH